MIDDGARVQTRATYCLRARGSRSPARPVRIPRALFKYTVTIQHVINRTILCVHNSAQRLPTCKPARFGPFIADNTFFYYYYLYFIPPPPPADNKAYTVRSSGRRGYVCASPLYRAIIVTHNTLVVSREKVFSIFFSNQT